MDKIAGAVTALWLIVSFACYISFENLEFSNHEYFHTCKVIEKSLNFYRHVAQTENYHRNYLLIGKPEYRVFYNKSKNKIMPSLQEVKEVATKNPQQDLLKDARQIVNYRFGIWDGTLAVYDKQGFEAARQHVAATYQICGVDKMHELRTIIDQIIDEEQKQLGRKEKENTYNFESVKRCIYGAVLISFIFFILPLYSKIKELMNGRN